METVTVERPIDASPDAVRDAMHDLEPFMASAGFDHVTVDGDRLTVANQVGPKEIELELVVEDEDDAALAYRQVDGIFEEMTTRYLLEEGEDGVHVEAETAFALDLAVVGGFLDATVISRQRRRELEAQMDYLEDVADDG